MRLGNSRGIVGVTAVLVSLVLMGCESDAQRIRETNTALTTPTKTSTSLSAEISYLEIEDGDCINSTLPEGISIETVVIVPCSETWQYRALSSFEVTGSNGYPGEDFFSQRARESCDRSYSYILFPPVESWKLGDRRIACLQEDFGLSATNSDKLDRLVSRDFLTSGECYNEAPETDNLQVELVNCSANWQYLVLNSFEVADSDRYPGVDFFAQRAIEYCDVRYDYVLYPIAESWRLGDRKVTCIEERT